MSSTDQSTASASPFEGVPPIEALLSELVATLAFAGNAYLAGSGGEKAVSLESASIAADVAGAAFDRISPRLGSEERTALSGLLTDLRLAYVRKRGT